MYKYMLIFVLLGLFLSTTAFAQTESESYTEYDSTHYSIRTQGSTFGARITAIQLETMYAFFNAYFHFPDSESFTPLRVLIFATKEQFTQHIQSLVQTEYDEFVYLHYGKANKNELIGFESDSEELAASFMRQAFLQFLRSHIANPPLWISEGFSTYIRNARFDPQTQTIIFDESTARAESLQLAIEQQNDALPLPVQSIFTITREDLQRGGSDFYATIWGFISYLLHTEKAEHARILWESIARLDPDTSLAENQETLQEHVYDWIDFSSLETALLSYLQDYETPYTLLGKGQTLLQEERYEEADAVFTKIITLQPDKSTGYYYRGLSNYHNGNYEVSIAFYEESATRGLDESLASFVVGLSRYALNEVDAAVSLLTRIPTTSQYYTRAQNLLSQWRTSE